MEHDEDIGDNRTTIQHFLQEEVALIDRDGDIEEEMGELTDSIAEIREEQ